MEKFKFGLFSLVTLALVGVLGYWSFSTIESGDEYMAHQKIKQLQTENEDLNKKVAELSSKVAVVEPEPEEPKVESTPKTEVTGKVVYKNQTLINELQKLVDDNVSMKLKSTGSRVGTVQKFLNLYNKTTTRVDNDYGDTTVKLVTEFQKTEGLTADGTANSATFKKMIAWLTKN